MQYSAFKKKYGVALNPQQEKTVQAVEGKVLLLAVPGSGKTTVLVTRLGYMVYAKEIPPENILTMTYTVAATGDMRRRFIRFFGEEMAARLEFRTINGVSARIIRSYERSLGRRAFELVADERALSALVSEVYRRITNEFPTDSEVKAVRTAITYVKNQMLTPAQVREMKHEVKSFPEIYQEYNRLLRSRGQMDYDDQMVYACQILEKYPEILAAYRQKYTYLCVDEGQDTSRIQHKIIALLVGQSGNLFMVGDEDQSIYGFRAACPDALMEFESSYPGAKVLYLETNYRSQPPIVMAAAEIIARNQKRRPKQMTAAREGAKPIRQLSSADRRGQYGYLLQLARECPEDTAVLYRDNDCALPLIDLMEREGVPYRCRQMDGGFFTHRITRDITDIIRLGMDRTDGEAFLRVYYKFGCGVSKALAQAAVAAGGGQENLLELIYSDSRVPEWTRLRCRALEQNLQAMEKEPGDKAVWRIVNLMGYGEYLENCGADTSRIHILEALGRQEPDPGALLIRLGQLQELVQREKVGSDRGLILSTIHSSKGLEYSRVILMDTVEGILPKTGEDTDEEEERRLFYVGMTRAKDELMIFSFRKPGYTSRFVRELFPALTEKKTPAKPKPRVKYGVIDPNLSLRPKSEVRAAAENYPEGTKIRHSAFGKGEILSRQGDLAQIRFADGSCRRLLISVAVKIGAMEKDEE